MYKDCVKISIVTISYNQARFLQECLASIKEQNYQQLQHIVIDGGSTDGTVEFLRDFSKLSLPYEFTWISEPDRGPADALNKGFQKASGDIFGFLNSDDILLPHCLDIVSTFFRKKMVDIIQGAGLIIDASGKLIRPVPSMQFSASAFMAKKHVIFQPSTFFSRRVYNDVGGFNINNRTSWDAEFFVNCSIRGYRFYPCRKTLAAFRLHNDSKSGSNVDAEKIKKDYARMWEMCSKHNIVSERLSLTKKLWGWGSSLPAIILSSIMYASRNGIAFNTN